jgi:hypothetical protein
VIEVEGFEPYNQEAVVGAFFLDENLRIFDKAGMDVPFIWSKVRKLRRELLEKPIVSLLW